MYNKWDEWLIALGVSSFEDKKEKPVSADRQDSNKF